jgi:hypothetical protein
VGTKVMGKILFIEKCWYRINLNCSIKL